MTNHPSRGWRRRAHEAAQAFAATLRVPPDGAAALLTPEQVQQIMRDAYVAGYGAGRIDGAPPRRTSP